jgi:hypothetical protein
MGKYASYSRPAQPDKRSVHPIWRGIGCLLLILIPVLSFAAARTFLQENSQANWISIPKELTGSMVIPTLGRVSYAELAFTIVFMVIGFGLMTVIYSMFYRLAGSIDSG